VSGERRTTATSLDTVTGRLEALLECVRVQQAALARGDLAEVRRQADRFDEIRSDLGPEAAAAGGDPSVRSLLEELVQEHQRLLTGVALLHEEVGQRLSQVRRRQPAVTAYGRQVAAAAGASAAAATAGTSRTSAGGRNQP